MLWTHPLISSSQLWNFPITYTKKHVKKPANKPVIQSLKCRAFCVFNIARSKLNNYVRVNLRANCHAKQLRQKEDMVLVSMTVFGFHHLKTMVKTLQTFLQAKKKTQIEESLLKISYVKDNMKMWKVLSFWCCWVNFEETFLPLSHPKYRQENICLFRTFFLKRHIFQWFHYASITSLRTYVVNKRFFHRQISSVGVS